MFWRARPAKDPAAVRRAALELALLALLAGLAFVLVEWATARWLARVAALAPAEAPGEDAVRGVTRQGALFYAGGAALLALGRAVSLRRARDPLRAAWLLPALCGAALLGLILHTATVEQVAGQILVPTTREFASGFLLGCALGAAILALPRDPIGLAARLKLGLLLGMVVAFVLLALYGSAPGESDARVNLGPFQPTEAIKAAFVIFVAVYLGERAAKLRFQRVRFAGLRWPRPVLFVPATVVLALVFLTQFALRDLGPTLILAPVFIGLFYLAARASGFALFAVLSLAGGVLALALAPDLAGDGLVRTRIDMWLDPWTNALSHGHQLGESLWATAAGGMFGQGVAHNHVPTPPAGKTDLMLALLVEQLGFAGLVLYLALLGVVIASALRIAACNRTPERGLAAAGVALLLLSQWAVIHAGTFGALPLSGVVVPFLSTGRSSMVIFVALVALVARLAEDGRPRAPAAELVELRAACSIVLAIAIVVLVAGGGLALYRASIAAEETSARGVLVELQDGTLIHRHDPRLVELKNEIPRGPIVDRHGEPLAEGGRPGAFGHRRYPLGPALGTLLGLPPGGPCLPWWPLERRLDERLRGYPERPDPPAYRQGCAGREPIPSPDLRPLAPVLRLPAGERAPAIEERLGDAESRSVSLTLDAGLQAKTHGILGRAAASSATGAAAAAVVDADTGQILARAQVPDYDPGDPALPSRLATRDPALTGAYGALADKTGLGGNYQAGSIAKLVTALAAARDGWRHEGQGCRVRAEPVLACEGDDERPSFQLPDWREPIRDFPGERPHGAIDVTEALGVSCNVFFGKLALSLGPEPLSRLVEAGLEIGPYDADGRTRLRPGGPQSRRLAETGYGQGGMWMNAVQAARLTAAIGAGGVYRRCPPTMELGEPCDEVALVPDPADVAPILAGMRAVMQPGGTAARLSTPPGVRVYGKTGTAESPGFVGEAQHGIEIGARAETHAWFVALAEHESAAMCGARERGRVAVAVVVPRGGGGGRAAGPPAMEILAALAEKGYFEPAGS